MRRVMQTDWEERHFVCLTVCVPGRQASLMGFRRRAADCEFSHFVYISISRALGGRTALLAGTSVCAGRDPKGLPCF